eukprot:PhF_6_TR42312/c0_g1_i1/m.63877
MRGLPRDCINHILSYCNPSTTSNAYLVCQSWYHAVDRCTYLADKFYTLTDTFETRRRRWCPSSKLSNLEHDERFQKTEVMYIKADTPVVAWSGHLASHVALRKLDASFVF